MKQGFLLLLGFLLIACEPHPSDNLRSSPILVSQRMGVIPDSGFKRALEPIQFQFPQDHGAHPDFATEWWYFTGNLKSDQGANYGYQLTLFRVGLKPGQPMNDSDWRSHQLYMGHMAISDIQNRKHLSAERFSREAAGLAGAENNPIKVWLGPWSIKGSSDQLFPLELKAETDEMAMDLTLSSGTKPRVLQGEQGLSRKGSAPGNASYYYSYTRLPTQGTLRLGDETVKSTGNSWFDREWSSSALAADQAGWDWLALQLDDGRDLMFYQMRDKQGQPQQFSQGILVNTNGQKQALSLDNTRLQANRFWKSDDGIEYPVSWQLSIPELDIALSIYAAFDNQLMNHTVRYWEGAVEVSGSHTGKGYLELSGYNHLEK